MDASLVDSAGFVEHAASQLNRLFLMDRPDMAASAAAAAVLQQHHQQPYTYGGHHHHGASHTSSIGDGGWLANAIVGSPAALSTGAGGPGGQQLQLSTMGPGVEHVGWGGQAIPDNNGYRVPWFGRPKGKGVGGKSKARSKVAAGERKGRHSGKGGWSRGGSDGEGISGAGSSEEVMSVEEVTAVIRAVPEGQPLPEKVYGALCHFDSRTASLLLKGLSKVGLGRRAVEVFDHLRGLDAEHALRQLCDVYTYTAMISMCIYQQNVQRALELTQEMRQRGIERNVHTYTALMNVCIKCCRCQLAVETYNKMRQDAIMPNVVTYNTLIDVYGKTGQWEQAVKVLGLMKSEGVDPVLRTFNTLIIACNMCNQPREALAVYNRLLSEGFTPNATTYNALISAYGKAGQLEKVMEVFQEMVWKGCERSVITYSSLISACEKAGQWEIALELFNEMHKEGCVPNTVTYNSLITACAQGAQWEKASEVFDQMQVQGCTPDVVTYTALISAYERGGQWRKALQAYEQMHAQGCRPDAIVYNAIIDAVWETGVIWAQRRALEIFKIAMDQGHFKQQALDSAERVEVNLHAMTAGVAVLSLYCWLLDLKTQVVKHGTDSLPAELCIVTDKGRNSKEQGNLVVKEAVAAMMNTWDAPFRSAQGTMYSGALDAKGSEVAQWLMSKIFEERLFSFFPCTNTISTAANTMSWDKAVSNDFASTLNDPDFSKEMAVESRCAEAFSAVHSFESTHSLALQAMGLTYLQHRTQLVTSLIRYGQQLGLKDEVAHDAVLLMDRTMSTAIQIKDNLLELLSVACLVLAMKQDEPIGNLPSDEEVEQVTDCKASAVAKMEWNLRQVLGSDTATISTLRCLKLYLERMGANFLNAKTVREVAGSASTLVQESMADVTFLNCRPSVVAAAILYAERRSRGIIPFWPSMLAKLTRYQDMSSPELTVAIRGAQKLCQRLSSSLQYSAPGNVDDLACPADVATSILTSTDTGIPVPTSNNLSLPLMAAVAAAGGIGSYSGASMVDLQSASPIAVAGLTCLNSLASQSSLASLASIQSLHSIPSVPALVSMPSVSSPIVSSSIQSLQSVPSAHSLVPMPSASTPVVSSGIAHEDQVTANHIDGMAQGLPQRVMQGVTHVAQAIPQGVASSLLSRGPSGQLPNTGFQQVAADSGATAVDLPNLG